MTCSATFITQGAAEAAIRTDTIHEERWVEACNAHEYNVSKGGRLYR